MDNIFNNEYWVILKLLEFVNRLYDKRKEKYYNTLEK